MNVKFVIFLTLVLHPVGWHLPSLSPELESVEGDATHKKSKSLGMTPQRLHQALNDAGTSGSTVEVTHGSMI